MTLSFRPASRKAVKLKISVGGMSGSGKTWGALELARGLASDWDKIAVLDTEKGADKYEHLGTFMVCEMHPPFEPRKFTQAVREAEKAGFEVLVIDSASHLWEGEGGCLEIVDNMKQASRAKDGFSAWNAVGKFHREFINACLQCSMHVILTVRKKTDYQQIEENGKKTWAKMGLKEQQRDGWEYEWDVAMTVERNHMAFCEKDRTNTVSDRPPFKLSRELGAELLNWARTGKPMERIEIYEGSPDQKIRLMEMVKHAGVQEKETARLTHLACVGRPWPDLDVIVEEFAREEREGHA